MKNGGRDGLGERRTVWKSWIYFRFFIRNPSAVHAAKISIICGIKFQIWCTESTFCHRHSSWRNTYVLNRGRNLFSALHVILYFHNSKAISCRSIFFAKKMLTRCRWTESQWKWIICDTIWFRNQSKIEKEFSIFV